MRCKCSPVACFHRSGAENVRCNRGPAATCNILTADFLQVKNNKGLSWAETKRGNTLDLFGTRSRHRHGAFHERKAPVLRFFVHKCTTMSCSADLCCRKSCYSWLTRPLFQTYCTSSLQHAIAEDSQICKVHGLSPTAQVGSCEAAAAAQLRTRGSSIVCFATLCIGMSSHFGHAKKIDAIPLGREYMIQYKYKYIEENYLRNTGSYVSDRMDQYSTTSNICTSILSDQAGFNVVLSNQGSPSVPVLE